MSINVQQRNFRLRKLGILRKYHLPTPPVESSRRAHTAPPKVTREESTSPSDDQYREKLRKLHQIRVENAQMDSLSRCNSNIVKDTSPDFSKRTAKFRCFTAPSCGGNITPNRNQVGSSYSLQANSVLEKYIINQQVQKTKQTTCKSSKEFNSPGSNSQYSDKTNAKPSSASSEHRSSVLGPSKRLPKQYSSFQSMKNALADAATMEVKRTKSAPAQVSETVRPKVDFYSESRNDRLEETKHEVHSPLLSRRRRPFTPSPSFAKMYTTRGGLIRFDEGPLDVVGRPWSPRRSPKLVRNHYRVPAVSFRRSASAPIKIPKREKNVPPDPPPSPRTLCLVPAPTKECSGCHCRSVRFSCSDNLVHEFEANEPIAADSDVFE